MAIKGTQYKCIAGAFTKGGISVKQGFIKKVHPDDPLDAIFKNNPAFEATPCHLQDYMKTRKNEDDGVATGVDSVVVNNGETAADTVEASVGNKSDSIDELDLPNDVIDKLLDSEYESVGDIVSIATDAGEVVDTLMLIEGIGAKTATKILAKCNEYLGK